MRREVTRARPSAARLRVILGVDVASMLLGGLAAGMVLFIVSVGLSVTMGLMGFVNLAHGGFAMLGGYAVVHAMKRLGLGFVPALAFGFALIAVASAVLERLLYARLYRAAELDQVLFTIGLVFVVIAAVTLRFGPENQPLPLPAALQGQIDLGFTRYRTYSIVLIAVGAAIALGLWLVFERTRMGAQIRAAVDNRRMAQSLGIDIDRLFTLTFAFGSGMAALGGGLGDRLPRPLPALRAPVPRLLPDRGRGRRHGQRDRRVLRGADPRLARLTLKKYLPQGGGFFIYALTILLLLWRPQGLFGARGVTGGASRRASPSPAATACARSRRCPGCSRCGWFFAFPDTSGSAPRS